MCHDDIRRKKNNGKVVYLTSADKIKFYSKVLPGSKLVVKSYLDSYKRGMGVGRGECFVDSKKVSSAEFSFVFRGLDSNTKRNKNLYANCIITSKKPRLVKKLKDFYEYVNKNDGKVGTKTRGIDLNFNNACNLRCKYCFTNSPKGDHVKEYLDYRAIASLADQADELGYFEFDLQGGELLLQPKKLFKVLEAIKPERFYMYLTTNGYNLDDDMARELAEANVSRVSVSIDSMDEKIHDEIRGRKDSWRRAMEGLKHVKNHGMDPYLNITVGRYNANTDHLKRLLDYSKDQKYKTLLNVAVPAGMWQKAEDIICNDEDRLYLRKLGKNTKILLEIFGTHLIKITKKFLGVQL